MAKSGGGIRVEEKERMRTWPLSPDGPGRLSLSLPFSLSSSHSWLSLFGTSTGYFICLSRSSPLSIRTYADRAGGRHPYLFSPFCSLGCLFFRPARSNAPFSFSYSFLSAAILLSNSSNTGLSRTSLAYFASRRTKR
jgi:hypothetical protein